jgi:hypothetical protein
VEAALLHRHEQLVDERLPLEAAARVEHPVLRVVETAQDGPQGAPEALGVDDMPPEVLPACVCGSLP